MHNTYRQNMNYEAEVRNTAEAVWGLRPGECQPTYYADTPGIRELDGLARLRDITHLIMATTSTRLEKVKEDVKKLAVAETIERTRANAVSKWLITEKQLDAQHIDWARKSNVIALTLDQFRRRFFDSERYLMLRNNWSFGSARDPNTDSINIADNAYVPLPMIIFPDSNAIRPKLKNRAITVDQIAQKLIGGEAVILRAPFGSGKSLTTREIFRRLSELHKTKKSAMFPLALNLREHWGEDHSDEILERHARSIGYTPREDLVVAWRAGMCSVLLDGFDELASQTVVRTDNKNFMREARKRALQGLRDFTTKIPKGVGILICGRDHYFDNESELINSLGLTGKPNTIVDIEEFTETSANEFLKRNGIAQSLPDWLPRKPLILSYLLRNDLFSDILEIDSSKGFGHAWDEFLRRICEREASLESSSMDPETIRAVLERLADSVRSKSSGTGPITGHDLSDAYTSETGQFAGEGVLAQLQRLPGLTQRESEPGSRSFVDLDMLGALQGGAFSRQLLSGFQKINLASLSEISDRAADMAIHILTANEAAPETLIGVSDQLQRRMQKERVPGQLIADCFTVAIRMAINLDRDEIDFRGLIVDGASLGSISLDGIRIKGVSFRNCTIREVSFGDAAHTMGVSFSNCIISKACGITSIVAMPPGLISDDCEIESFDNMATNNAILKLDIPPQIKALVTVLRKLYKQAGAGRKLGAFERGISQPEVLRFINPVLELLERHEFIATFNAVVHPIRKQASRVENILAAPLLVEDSMMTEVRELV